MEGTTVVIATRDRVADLTRTLTRLAELDVPVVVVDNGSSDDTVRVSRRFPRVEVLPMGRNLGAIARNHGVRHASTPYVAFSDDDSWWSPDALPRAEDLFSRHPRLGLIAAKTLVEPSGRVDPICEDMASSPLGQSADLPGPSVFGFLCCASIVRRSAFLEVGGFHPLLFFRGEERLFAWDLAARGWACAYVDSVTAHHHPSPTRASPSAGRRRELRNDLLTTWLRRPPAVAIRAALHLARQAAHDPAARGALAEALLRLRPVLRSRHRLPPHVEQQIGRMA
ncbi:glycosyltransferase family 2 protein [Saccharothrix variisporea]|uniref:GT2 family glycosyltransferase n=1 Tax=Saccharothrix variisporea TaxID=543527 RepID=A0A495XB69_9PSEU|nr:glycosyltransferase [Saccharothrix variisporea]RKT68768.1 GT2 family glycosyltransferase [Saccharothrix variisporea]